MSGGLTHERLRELVNYDPETGLFTRRVAMGPRGCFRVGTVIGTVVPAGYRQMRVEGVRTYAHRLAWFWMTGTWPEVDVDHKNGHKDDNRWGNLRPATRSQNLQNRNKVRTDSTSGVTGVSWYATRSKWAAQIVVAGRHRSLGYFDTLGDAAEYRQLAEAMLHPFSKSAATLPVFR